MSGMIDKALASYTHEDFHVRMKARFFLIICIALAVIIPIVIIYSIYYQTNDPLSGYRINPRIILPQIFCFLAAVIALLFLIRGSFSLAAHLILTGSLIAVWTIVFIEHSHVLARLDSVVLCVGLLSMMPLVIGRRKWVIFLYGIANIAVLFAFIAFSHVQLQVPGYVLADYLSDVTVAFVFVCITTYSVFAISSRALTQAASEIRERKQAEAQAQLRYASAARMYFSSVANQTRFTTLRDALLDKNPSLPEGKRQETREAMREILREEIQLAQDLFILTRRDSCIGFEASNHYFYVPVDLMEKAINCQYILDHVDELYK